MQKPDINELVKGDIWVYENALTEYYTWQDCLKNTKKGYGCPICGKKDKGLSKLSKHHTLCQSCSEKITSQKTVIQNHLFEKTIRQEKISSHEIPFLISLSDEDKYDFLFNLLEKQKDLGKKVTLELVRKFIAILQIPTDTAFFFEIFYPEFLREFTTDPGLLPVWCTDAPIGMKEVKKPGEMIHYIDSITISDQQPIQKKKRSGKLFSLTWGKERIYSVAKEGEDIEWEFFEKYQGTVVITSERIIPLLSDGTYPFVFLISRISSLKMIPEGVEIIIEGHERPFRIEGMNNIRGDNLIFCMERLVRKGTIIEWMEEESHDAC